MQSAHRKAYLKAWYEANKARYRQRYLDNREKFIARTRANYFANRDEWIKYHRAYHETHKEQWRVRTQNRSAKCRGTGTLSRDLPQKLMVAQHSRCRYCEADLAITGYHLDHAHPLAKGGLNVDSNIVLACPSCNNRKRAQTAEEFISRMVTNRLKLDNVEILT